MRITEQIDALESISFNPVSYLIMPRMVASLIMFPYLVIIGDIFGLITALGLAVGAKIIRSVRDKDLVPAAVIGKFLVAIFALFFVDNLILQGRDNIIVPLMCILCVAIPFVLVTIAPRFIPAAEVNLFFLLETIIGPIWVWLIIKEQPSIETLQGGIIIICTIAIHSFLKLKNS